MAGLGKGLALIEAFGREHPRLTVADAARATDTTRATARRCLLTLEALGYVVHDGKFFHPTPRMLRLGASFLETSPLPTLAQPHLESARNELAESISLAVLEEDWSVFVARAEAQRIVSTGVRLGARLPAHASATGRVLLAALSDEELDAHLRLCRPRRQTPHTITGKAAIRTRVETARDERMAYTDEELELGMRTMAVPVADARGTVRAAMSVSTFAARVTLDEMREQFLPVLRVHADRVGRML
ncbi:IclR family transcriptional regulator domain-containing protein [Pseudonocardia spinosispora]|uniref:IclR family transcriptional regulator domain-containing protein n=1 Tax=Pseudonocardia spinosispora TaxID=103441 RepID=UPI000425E649|nr:IclR family transcriptional regulator C-terminal domain-containing protein [Pseudonocardia spinosispora]